MCCFRRDSAPQKAVRSARSSPCPSVALDGGSSRGSRPPSDPPAGAHDAWKRLPVLLCLVPPRRQSFPQNSGCSCEPTTPSVRCSMVGRSGSWSASVAPSPRRQGEPPGSSGARDQHDEGRLSVGSRPAYLSPRRERAAASWWPTIPGSAPGTSRGPRPGVGAGRDCR
jgi:hypothetical protein